VSEPLPAVHGLIGDVVQRALRMTADEFGKIAGGQLERRGIARGHHDGKGARLGQGRCRGRVGDVALQNHVRIGTAEAEGVHADHQPAAGAQRFVGGRHLKIPIVEGNVWIRGIHPDVCRYDPVTQAVQRLDESGDT
jgi:hypothetical protein